MSHISLYNNVLSLFLFRSPFFSPSFFSEFLLSFLLLDQANVKTVPSVASSLEPENSEGECRLLLLCFLFLPFFSYTFSPPSSSMAKPPASLPFFSHFATVSSPFLQFALCPFLESSKKSEEQEEEASPQEADTGLLFFFFFFVTPPPFFFLELSLFFFF